jgi:hypothetical protein
MPAANYGGYSADSYELSGFSKDQLLRFERLSKNHCKNVAARKKKPEAVKPRVSEPSSKNLSSSVTQVVFEAAIAALNDKLDKLITASATPPDTSALSLEVVSLRRLLQTEKNANKELRDEIEKLKKLNDADHARVNSELEKCRQTVSDVSKDLNLAKGREQTLAAMTKKQNALVSDLKSQASTHEKEADSLRQEITKLQRQIAATKDSHAQHMVQCVKDAASLKRFRMVDAINAKRVNAQLSYLLNEPAYNSLLARDDLPSGDEDDNEFRRLYDDPLFDRPRAAAHYGIESTASSDDFLLARNNILSLIKKGKRTEPLLLFSAFLHTEDCPQGCTELHFEPTSNVFNSSRSFPELAEAYFRKANPKFPAETEFPKAVNPEYFEDYEHNRSPTQTSEGTLVRKASDFSSYSEYAEYVKSVRQTVTP